MFDTNVVFDLLHFDDPAARPLRHALDTRRVRCVVSAATLDEWRRVLAYPAFGLDATQQARLLGDYAAWAQHAEGTVTAARLPRCSDPDDQKFLELAAASGAHALVSKDRAVLRLRRRCAPLFHVLDPGEAVQWLAAPTA